jgi:hypothetical protein
LPRPEYPRPDRQRGFVQGIDWLNLNGAWEFRFDGDRVGEEQRWFEPTEEHWPEQIIVPFCWESLAAWGEADAAGNDNYYATRVYRNPLGVTRENYRGAERFEVGWYRRQITVPPSDSWKNKRVILTIGAADFFTDLWCNRLHLGHHEGGYDPIEFDLTEALAPNDSGQLTGTIVIRVEDPMDNTEQPVGKQWAWYSTASGIWQTVFLEPRAPRYVERFEITTDLERSEAHFRIFTSADGPVLLAISSPEGQEFTGRAEARDRQAECMVSLGKAVWWDTAAPRLYHVRFNFGDDTVHGYFGMRSLAAGPVAETGLPSALTLNGEPIYIRGALYQSYYPDGIYTAGDAQALRDDIAYAKRVGFDLLRVHIKVDDPLLLYYADTLGMLLMYDMPNFGEGGDTPLGRRRYEETMRAAIARDFNHPSIIAWCLFNETWGFGGQSEFARVINPHLQVSTEAVPLTKSGQKLSNERAYDWIQEMWNLAKQLDPTRLVEDMSVVAWGHVQYYGHGATDVNSWHFYLKYYEQARAAIDEVVGQTYSGSSFNYIPGFQQGSQPLICSEYGGIGALDGDVDTSWSFKFLTNELRRHPQLSAYIYTELHDVEWERNGFLNYDRTPKDFGYDPAIVNHSDVLPIDAPPIRRCAPGEEIEVDVCSSHFSRSRRRDVVLQWRFSGIDSLGWIHDGIALGSEPIDFPHLRLAPAKTLRLRMPDQTMLCTLWVRALVPDGTLVAANYIQFFVDGGAPVWQQMNRRTVFRLGVESWSSSDWNAAVSTREEAGRSGCACGSGRGWFEWKFPAGPDVLRGAERITLLYEASAFGPGAPQTDRVGHPSTLRILLNGVPVYRTILPNHPHDARGALTYLRGGRGAYGYLCHATIEGPLLAEVLRGMKGNHLRVRCLAPRGEPPSGGLAIYGFDAGRYPIGPTLIVE